MRKFLAALAVSLAALSAVAFVAAPATAQVTVSISLFHQNLAPHGRWFHHPRWGWAWFPTAVDPYWRPYSRGRWVWTEEYGWYWASDETFGWAVYHYGRWAYDEIYGWIWIPGETWGPAWVAFRYSDSDIGWAPLPPETLDASYGWDRGYTDLSASYYQPRWVFVPRRFFLAPRLYAYAAPPSRNVIFIRQTVNVTNYVTVNRVVVNRSIEPRRIEAATGRRVRPTHINVVDDHRRVASPGAQPNTINVFRPTVRRLPDAAPPEPARAKPHEKPRIAIRKDAIAPSERRDAGPTTPPPGTAVPPKTTTPPATVVPKTTTPPTIPPKTTRPPATVVPKTTAPPTIPPKTTTPPAKVVPKTTAPPTIPPKTTTPPITTPTPKVVPSPSTAPRVTAPPPPPAKVQPPPVRPSPPPCGGPGQPPCPPR
jgi:hypothetical protein